MFMIDFCPINSSQIIESLCLGTNEAFTSYQVDVPVVSLNTSTMYANIFCALCHNDEIVKPLNVSINCNFHFETDTDFIHFEYQKRELKWLIPIEANNDSSTIKECFMTLSYDEDMGRACENEVIDNCPLQWSDNLTTEQCAQYSDLVKDSKGNLYKNSACAICNNVDLSNLFCAEINRNSEYVTEPDLVFSKNLTIHFTEKICGPHEIWDIFKKDCVIFQCPEFYKLQNGKCYYNATALFYLGKYTVPRSCYSNTYLSNETVLFDNETIYVNATETYYYFGEFEFTKNDLVKVCKSLDGWTPNMILVSNILICISLICMLLHICIFILLPKRRNIPSKNLFSMTCCLFVVEFLYSGFFHSTENYIACLTVGVLLYFFLSVAFLWTNIMSIDVYRTFCSNTYQIKSKGIFIQYSIYAWTIPSVTTILAIAMNEYTSENFFLNPQFGTHKCWFNNKLGLVCFFTIPAGCIVLINMCLYALSVYYIYKQYKMGKMASKTGIKGELNSKNSDSKDIDNKKEGNTTNLQNDIKKNDKSSENKFAKRIKSKLSKQLRIQKKLRVRLALYCKLALIMGLTWVFAFMSIHTQLIVFEYLFIVFNGLQGTFIFLAFDAKKKILNDLKVRLGLQPETVIKEPIRNAVSIEGSSAQGNRFSFSKEP